MQKAAGQAYADRNFDETLSIVDGLVREEPDAARFHEMRAQVGTTPPPYCVGFRPLGR